MKKIALIAMMACASAAFADDGGMGGRYRHNNGQGNHHQNSAPSLEATVLLNTAVINSASGHDGVSQQNLASNVGNFTDGTTQLQLVYAKDSFIKSEGTWGGQAQQNISSNAGSGSLHTATYQIALIKDSAVINKATMGARAYQNISSNSNCVTCQN
jgi:hypothetical protein